jgi:hypothetical protein
MQGFRQFPQFRMDHITSGLPTDRLQSAHRSELLKEVSHSAGCKSPFTYICFLALWNLLRADGNEKIGAPVHEM